MPVYRARVTKVDSSGVFVVVPDLGGGKFEWGPLSPVSGLTLVAGDSVLVGGVGDVRDDLVLVSGQGGPGGTLDGLSDVVITAAAVGDILTFNGTNWVNAPRWPIGSVYMTADDAFDPNLDDSFGGVWEKAEAKYIAATGTPFPTVGGTAFGSDTITLIEANLPAHAHAAGTLANAAESSHTHGAGTLVNAAESSHTHGVGTYVNGNQSASHTHDGSSLSTNTTGAHKHTLNRDDDGQIFSSGTRQWVLHSVSSGGDQVVDTNVGSAGDHSHTVSGSTGTQSASHAHTITGSSAAGSSHNHTISGSTAAGSSHNHAISGSTGNGAGTSTAITNRPLGIAFNVWVRTS